uniref:ORF1 protein n=1 Tax=Trichovirus mali TaxID=12175 RepID=A0A1W6FBN9_9VIRU|nr:RNA-dependent RNA polymerase [Apple chlorotic leaf spot virus]
MAFSYRTPQEELLSRLPQAQQEVISGFQYERIQKEEEKKVENFSFYLPEKTREWFTKSGVYLSPFAYVNHSHPGCKTLENHLLFNVVASYISKYSYVACLSIKANKMSKMERLGPNSVKSYDILNRLVTAKDKARYGPLARPERSPCPKRTNIFIHDEIHYWSRDQLETFLQVHKPKNLWATLVFPPEILAGYKSSVLPFLYQFEIHGKDLVYMPDGVRSESYTQPLENGYLLSSSSILVRNRTSGVEIRYQVSLVYSLGSHHLFHIYPTENLLKEEVRRFGPYDLFDVGSLFVKPVRAPIQDFPLSVFKKIFIYLSSLKKPDVQSAVAKLRQLSDADISIESVFMVQEFASRIERNGVGSWSCSFWECMKDWFFDKLPYRELLERVGLADDFTRRLMKLKPLAFDIYTSDRPLTVRMIIDQIWEERVSSSDDLPNIIFYGRNEWIEHGLLPKVKKGLLKLAPGREGQEGNYPTEIFSDLLSSTSIWRSHDDNLGNRRASPVVILKSNRSYTEAAPFVSNCLSLCPVPAGETIERTSFELEFLKTRKTTSMDCLNFHIKKAKVKSVTELNAKFAADGERFVKVRSKKEKVKRNRMIPIHLLQGFQKEKHENGKEAVVEEAMISSTESSSSSTMRSTLSEGKEKNVSRERGGFMESIEAQEIKLNLSDLVGREKICEAGLIKTVGNDYLALSEQINDLPLGNFNKKKAAYFCLDFPMVYFHDRISYPTFEATGEVKKLIINAKEKWGIDFNSALVQVYEDGCRLPLHADDEECYDDDGILTVNVTGDAKFHTTCHDELLELKQGNELLMPAGFQKRNRHAVEVMSEGRTSVTLRVHRRDFSFESKLRFIKGKFDCLFVSIAEIIHKKPEEVMMLLPHVMDRCVSNKGCSIDDAKAICERYEIKIECEGDCGLVECGSEGLSVGRMLLRGNHFTVASVRRSSIDSLANSVKDVKSNGVLDHVMFNFHKRLRAVEPDLTIEDIKIDSERAGKLLKSLMDGMTGIVSHNSTHEGWRMIKGINSTSEMRTFMGMVKGKSEDNQSDLFNKIQELNFIKMKIYGIFGFAGSGKSHAIQNLINSEFKGSQGIMVICPRRFLAKDWSEKGVEERDIKTFESALKSDIKGKRLFILDEVSLLPKGFTDLLMLKMHMEGVLKKSTVVCIGDPLQASYFCPKDDSYLSREGEIKRLFKKGVNYKWYSYRVNKFIAKKLAITTLNDFVGIDEQSSIYKDMPSAHHFMEKRGNHIEVILVASMIEKELYSNYGNVMTFGESQGLTFNCGVIVLSEEAKLCSDAHIMVAITRFRRGFCFALGSKGSKEDYMRSMKSGLLQRMCSGIGASKEFILGSSSVELILSEKDIAKGAGVDEMDREARLEGDVWLKSMVYLGKRYHLVEPLGQIIKLTESAIKCHIPVCSHQTLMPELDNIQAREFREFKGRNGWSNQFREEAGPNWKFPYKVNQAMSYEAVYPRHKMDDDLTFLAAIKKRLRFDNVANNYAKFKAAESRGKYLAKVFLNHVPIKCGRDQRLLDQCRQEFEETKLSKSAATIGAHSQRSDADWPLDKIFLFMKSQLCTKFEKRFTEAKAGQTLACFPHKILVEFSPWCRYTEKVLTANLPENYYIHQRKNFSELEDFAKKFSNGSVCVESDYTAFDVSQDHTILAFEVELLRHFGWDDKILQSYIRMKCTLGCRLGGFAIMRFTGEFSTFLFNTLANMVFTFCRYEVPSGTPICFAGDDMCALRNLREINSHEFILNKLSLKAKVNRTKVPMFCGWRLCCDGLIKEPCLIYERLQVAIENGRLMDVIDSYFLEFSFAYKLGERLYTHLEIEQLNYHQVLTRFFIRNKHLLRGDSRYSISELEWLSDEDGDDDQGSQIKDRRRGYSNCWGEKLQNLF